jgi:hypothetical protein
MRFKNGFKKPLHSNFKALMSVMKNVLKKDITVEKSVNSGRFQLRLLIIFINPDYGQDFKVLSWLYESVISGTKLPVRFSFICLLYTVMLNLLVWLFDNIGVLKTRLIGLLTVHLLRMLAAFALSTVLEILLFYDALLSMPSTANTLINVVSDKK